MHANPNKNDAGKYSLIKKLKIENFPILISRKELSQELKKKTRKNKFD